MSTKFTNSNATLTPLSLLMQTATRWVNRSVLSLMATKGYSGLTEPHLNLLANLDCGITHASAVAQQMGVSRQAIYRTTSELQQLGILTLEEDPKKRNQKLIVMTELGMRLALDARNVLNEIESELAERVGVAGITNLRTTLEAEWGDVLSGTDRDN